MNIKDNVFRSKRGRSRFGRGGLNVVSIQWPMIGSPRRPARKNTVTISTRSTNLIWKQNPSSHGNTSGLQSTSTTRSHSTSEMDSMIIVAVTEGRGDATCEVGIAAVDVVKPSLILCQLSDTPSYVNTLTKINILNPNEILIPKTCIQNRRLTNKLMEYFTEIKITGVNRSTFDKNSGLQYIKEYCASEWNSVLLVLQQKYYALSAAAALIGYCETCLYTMYAKQSIKVEYQASEGCTMIDVMAADKLELVASTAPNAGKYSSIYGILNYCLTKIGSRTLRAEILQPSCSVPQIEAKLNCIEEIKSDPHMFNIIKTSLVKLANIDQLMTLAIVLPNQEQNCSEQQLNYILNLNSLLEVVDPLKEAFANSEQPFFNELKNTLSDNSLQTIKDCVRSMIHEDARPAKGTQAIMQRCFAIKTGVNGLLDLVRKSYSERTNDMKDYVKNLAEKYALPLSLSNNYKKGYHIYLSLNARTKKTFKISDLPPEFIQVNRMLNNVTMKTLELINFSSKLDDLMCEILKMSNIMICEILVKIRENIGILYTLCEQIAKLDLLQSLAQASSVPGYVRPQFGDYLEVINSRHPLLDYLCSTTPVGNDVFASNDYNMHIVTGPNGSGKSIFLRQIFLLQVIAQVGCFVPAETAMFRVCDRLLARVYLEDNMDCGVSAFGVEMKEIVYFLNVMSKNTLIIVDELCRSTSVEEGTALAMAIYTELLHTKAFIFCSTHYVFLCNLEKMYCNVKCWQLETIEELKDGERFKLHFKYKIIPGVTNLKNYGLYMARISWPGDIVQAAENLMSKYEERTQVNCFVKVSDKNRLKYDLEADLRLMKMKSQFTFHNFVRRMQQYVSDMSRCGLKLDIEQLISRCNVKFDRHVGDICERETHRSRSSSDSDAWGVSNGKSFAGESGKHLVRDHVCSPGVTTAMKSSSSGSIPWKVPIPDDTDRHFDGRHDESVEGGSRNYLIPEVVYSESGPLGSDHEGTSTPSSESFQHKLQFSRQLTDELHLTSQFPKGPHSSSSAEFRSVFTPNTCENNAENFRSHLSEVETHHAMDGRSFGNGSECKNDFFNLRNLGCEPSDAPTYQGQLCNMNEIINDGMSQLTNSLASGAQNRSGSRVDYGSVVAVGFTDNNDPAILQALDDLDSCSEYFSPNLRWDDLETSPKISQTGEDNTFYSLSPGVLSYWDIDKVRTPPESVICSKRSHSSQGSGFKFRPFSEYDNKQSSSINVFDSNPLSHVTRLSSNRKINFQERDQSSPPNISRPIEADAGLYKRSTVSNRTRRIDTSALTDIANEYLSQKTWNDTDAEASHQKSDGENFFNVLEGRSCGEANEKWRRAIFSIHKVNIRTRTSQNRKKVIASGGNSIGTSDEEQNSKTNVDKVRVDKCAAQVQNVSHTPGQKFTAKSMSHVFARSVNTDKRTPSDDKRTSKHDFVKRSKILNQDLSVKNKEVESIRPSGLNKKEMRPGRKAASAAKHVIESNRENDVDSLVASEEFRTYSRNDEDQHSVTVGNAEFFNEEIYRNKRDSTSEISYPSTVDSYVHDVTTTNDRCTIQSNLNNQRHRDYNNEISFSNKTCQQQQVLLDITENYASDSDVSTIKVPTPDCPLAILDSGEESCNNFDRVDRSKNDEHELGKDASDTSFSLSINLHRRRRFVWGAERKGKKLRTRKRIHRVKTRSAVSSKEEGVKSYEGANSKTTDAVAPIHKKSPKNETVNALGLSTKNENPETGTTSAVVASTHNGSAVYETTGTFVTAYSCLNEDLEPKTTSFESIHNEIPEIRTTNVVGVSTRNDTHAQIDELHKMKTTTSNSTNSRRASNVETGHENVADKDVVPDNEQEDINKSIFEDSYEHGTLDFKDFELPEPCSVAKEARLEEIKLLEKNEQVEEVSKLDTSKNSSEKKVHQGRKKMKKFVPPLLSNATNKKMLNFNPQKTLTKREIREEFFEQDKKMMMDCDLNISQHARLIMNRPSANQLQNQMHLALLKKTEEGVVVIPTRTEKARPTNKLKRKPYVTDFDVTLLSDENALRFKNFLQSNEESENQCHGVFARNVGSRSKIDDVSRNTNSVKKETNFNLGDNKLNGSEANEPIVQFDFSGTVHDSGIGVNRAVSKFSCSGTTPTFSFNLNKATSESKPEMDNLKQNKSSESDPSQGNKAGTTPTQQPSPSLNEATEKVDKSHDVSTPGSDTITNIINKYLNM